MSQAQRDAMKNQVDAQKTQTDQQTGMNIAGREASSKGFDAQELLSTDFLTTFTDPKVDRSYGDDDSAQYNIEELLAAEFSPQLQLGQITRDEYYTEKQMDKARRMLAMCQFADPHGVGSKCKEDTRARMLGGHSSKQDEVGDYREASDDMRQQIRTAYETRSHMRSGSIGGRVLRGFFESVAVARSEGFDFDGEGGGLLNKLTGGMVG